MRALIVEAVSKSRGTGAQAVPVLHQVSLAVDPGECISLEGPSGSGKTTLLAVAGGILTPDEGLVVLAGRELHGTSRAEDRRWRSTAVGFVFQRWNLLPRLTVRENVLLMGRIAGHTARETERDADDLLERLGLSRLGARYPRELSGGEEQRVAVARALVHRPAVVLADEPTGSLDVLAGQAVMEELTGLAKLNGTAIVIATHDPRIASFATRRIGIEDGRIRA